MAYRGHPGVYEPSGNARMTWASRPRYGLDDMATLLWRQRLMIIIVFAVVFALGALIALGMPRQYTAYSSILVQLNQDNVYEPRAGDAARGAIPEVTDVVQAEAAILGSAALHERVVSQIGADVILGEDGSGSAEARQRDAVVAVGRSLEIGTAPDTGVVQLSYKHEDSQAAAAILNQIVASYLDYRREVFRDTTTPLLAQQRDAIERQLDSADQAYGSFLQQNDIGDFGTERTAVQTSYQTIFNERLSIEAQLRQAEGRLATLRQAMASVPERVALQEDLNLSAQDQLLNLRTEREQLLSRYQPDSQPVRDIDARIAQLQTYVGGGDATGVRDMRMGPNPVWQELETDRVRVQAERDSLAARHAALTRQLEDLEDRQAQLTQLESRNGALAAEREVLTETYREFTARQAQSTASAELASRGADRIRVIAPAEPPQRASSLKKPVLVLAFLFAAFTALCAGLLRVFLGRRFVTPGSASRTLDLPVLAVAPAKAR